MFHPLAYDARFRTYLAQFSGTLTAQDLVELDEAAKILLSQQGPVAGILDFSAVESCDLKSDPTAARGRQPQIMVGQKRAIVASGVVFGMMRMFATYQSKTGVEPLVLRTLPEAYEALGLVAEDFHPVAFK